MFGFSLEEKIEILEGYLKMNDVLKDKDVMAEEIEKFNNDCKELAKKHFLKEPGYEKYTDEYLGKLKRVFYEKMFEDYPGLDKILIGLKTYMKTRNSKVFKEAEMTFGNDPKKLSVEEMLYNEKKAKSRLGVLKVDSTVKNMLNKGKRV